MGTRDLLQNFNFAILAFSAIILFLMGRNRELRQFSALAWFLAAELINEAVTIPLVFFRRYTGIPKETAYTLYFYAHWVFFAVESVLMVAIIYSIYDQLMRPLSGLQKIGRVVFRWIAGVSILLAACLAVGPHLLFSSADAWTITVTVVATRFQEGTSVLSLCLLLFVCFATKPLGLTYRSRIFGSSLGLGVFATVDLVQSAWFSISQAHSLYSPIYLVSAIGFCVALCIWGYYFAMPEPAREMVLLPTTSPYFLWNRISEALGDSPGNVLLNFKPDMLAPAEIENITSMSKAARLRSEARSNAPQDLSQEVVAR